MSSEHMYSRSSQHYAEGVAKVTVVHERGRGIAWRIWPGAHVLLEWLESHKLEWLSNPCHCIEIGAGVGLVGVVCAGLGCSRVTLTDLHEELFALERSVESNCEAVKERLQVRAMSFGNHREINDVVNSVSKPHKLVVVGSELIYWETLFVPIAETLRELIVNHGGVAYIGYRKRVYKTEKRFITKILKQYGLEAQVMGQWMAVEEDGSSQRTDGQVLYKKTEGEGEEEWNTRVYKIFTKSQRIISDSVGEDGCEAKKATKKAPEIVTESPPSEKKKDAKKKPKIVHKEKKGRVR